MATWGSGVPSCETHLPQQESQQRVFVVNERGKWCMVDAKRFVVGN
jgi:hypothetical protein